MAGRSRQRAMAAAADLDVLTLASESPLGRDFAQSGWRTGRQPLEPPRRERRQDNQAREARSSRLVYQRPGPTGPWQSASAGAALAVVLPLEVLQGQLASAAKAARWRPERNGFGSDPQVAPAQCLAGLMMKSDLECGANLSLRRVA